MQPFFTTPPNNISPPLFALGSLMSPQQQEQPKVFSFDHIPASLMESMVTPVVPSVPTPVVVEQPTTHDQDRKEEQCCIRTWVNDFDWMTDKKFMDRIFPNIITELIDPDQPSPSPIRSQQQEQPADQVRAGYQDLSTDGSHVRKGAWTEDEHRRFLEGQALYPNNWKKISTDFVPTRTSTQVASHNQKFKLGLAATGRKRGRRSSKNPIG